MMQGLIKYSGFVPSDMAKRALNSIFRAGFHNLGVYWAANFRQKHFTNAGAREYGYAPRSGERGRSGKGGFMRSYTGRKLRTKGHTRPLVFTGRSEHQTRAARIQSSSANMKSGVRVIMRAPALNFRRGEIDMRKELTTISQPEQVFLTRLLGRYIEGRFRNYKATRTVPIAGGASAGGGRTAPARGADGRFLKKA